MDGGQTTHACCVVVGAHGVIIRGPSGSGKTTLALGLVAAATAASRFAVLVSDDQVLLERSFDRLLARAPGTIAGLAEARGAGVVRVRHLDAAIVDLIVDLAPEAQVTRVAEPARLSMHGVRLASLVLPERNQPGGVTAILAALGLSPSA